MQFSDGLVAGGARGVERPIRDGERGGALRRRVGGQPGFDAGKGETRRGQLGAHAVVQFARHMAAGRFPRLNEFSRQLTHASAQLLKLTLSGGLRRSVGKRRRNVGAKRDDSRRIHNFPSQEAVWTAKRVRIGGAKTKERMRVSGLQGCSLRGVRDRQIATVRRNEIYIQ
jgi:hypothetical protein